MVKLTHTHTRTYQKEEKNRLTKTLCIEGSKERDRESKKVLYNIIDYKCCPDKFLSIEQFLVVDVVAVLSIDEFEHTIYFTWNHHNNKLVEKKTFAKKNVRKSIENLSLALKAWFRFSYSTMKKNARNMYKTWGEEETEEEHRRLRYNISSI